MKKSLIFAAAMALSISPMAIAQNAPPPPDAPPASTSPDAPMPPVDAAIPAPAAEQPPMPEATPPAAAEPVMQSQPMPTATSALDRDYPVCSKSVTDNCRNASEGGMATGMQKKHNMKKK